MKNTAILLVQCPDRKGLDATIAEFIYRYDGNILHFEQHQAGEERYYLARVEWDLDGFRLNLKDFDGAFGPIAHKFGMNWGIRLGDYRARVAIFVSKYDHCLVDLLYRQRSGELACEFPLIIGNHPDTKGHADFYSVPFHLIPVSKENKPEAEARQLQLLEENRIDLVVLARYMQVLSSDFIARYPQPIINIHHSFLPAFVGAKPHHQAHRTRSETNRSDGSLCDGSAGRWTDHRAGRGADLAPGYVRGHGGEGQGRGESGAVAGGALACGEPDSAVRE